MDAFFSLPRPVNEPVLNYALGSPERKRLKEAIEEARSKEIDIPMYIDGQQMFTQHGFRISPPHDHQHTLGYFSIGTGEHVRKAIAAALKAKPEWEKLPWEARASIFLKAAELLAGPYRAKINAATMLCQSKNAYQAEIDSACEMIDFLRFNVKFMEEIYKIQPESSPGMWNRIDYKPLEGFVFALSPFNFTAIAGNLPTAPAMLGNTVVWKPAFSQVYSASILMEVFMKAGLPDGVINLIYTDGPETGDIVFKHPDFCGIHFTGSTTVFQNIWKSIGDNIHTYKNYPRIVGETGGKDFVLAHSSADVKALAVALVRGAFEYQGQKCSAASRAYIPQCLWPEVKRMLLEDLNKLKMGGVEDFSNFINAVIDEKSFDRIKSYIDKARTEEGIEIIAGGGCDKSKGYFIEPTVIVTQNPLYQSMCEEIFGPVLTIYVYEEDKFEEVLELTNKSTVYGLTGALFASDRKIIKEVSDKLRYAAGNFYINDKPTGAVVGQQPFGGGRASGTNDKAGSVFNLLRWVSPRVIKENLLPPLDISYPFMQGE